MNLFFYEKAYCSNCNKGFPLKWYQKVMRIIRIGNMSLIKCPHCKTFGMCIKYR